LGTVQLQLPQIEGAYEGMFGRLKIPAGVRRHLCLNQQAVQTIGQLTFVDVVRDDNTLERRLVKLGREGMPGRVEVISGLEPDERVLLRPSASTSEQ
jgi:multidrug efflux pump subunit AcrA (membrane-fusion protein)